MFRKLQLRQGAICNASKLSEDRTLPRTRRAVL